VRELLAKGCALDLHPRVFRGDRCAQTYLARAQVILLAQPEQPAALRILARSSFARYVADWLLDAAVEYHVPALGVSTVSSG
jgi:sarcosine oxidase, subunit gamma